MTYLLSAVEDVTMAMVEYIVYGMLRGLKYIHSAGWSEEDGKRGEGCVSVYLCICVSVCLCVCVSVCLYVQLSTLFLDLSPCTCTHIDCCCIAAVCAVADGCCCTGVIHRDLKPSNILLSSSLDVRLRRRRGGESE